jgi:hypothetical protein
LKEVIKQHHAWSLNNGGTLNPETRSPSKPNHPIKINRQSLHNSWDNYLDVRRPQPL